MHIAFDTDETIIGEVRKHWFVLATQIAMGAVAAFVPLVLYAIFSVLPITIDATGNATMLFLFVYATWLLIVWTVLFFLWTDYYLDVWIVTNKRIIDIEQKGLFRREIATMQLSKIQDVTTEMNGLFATMMKFGDIHVQTAGNEREFVIRGVAHPEVSRNMLEAALHAHGNPAPRT